MYFIQPWVFSFSLPLLRFPLGFFNSLLQFSPFYFHFCSTLSHFDYDAFNLLDNLSKIEITTKSKSIYKFQENDLKKNIL